MLWSQSGHVVHEIVNPGVGAETLDDLLGGAAADEYRDAQVPEASQCVEGAREGDAVTHKVRLAVGEPVGQVGIAATARGDPLELGGEIHARGLTVCLPGCLRRHAIRLGSGDSTR